MGEYKHLKVQIYRVENCILLRILEQTGIHSGDKWVSAKTGYGIRGASLSEIGEMALYVRGDVTSANLNMVIKELDSVETAKEVYQTLIDTIKEFNQFYSGGIKPITHGDLDYQSVGG